MTFNRVNTRGAPKSGAVLSDVLAGQRAGVWVILDPTMSRVMAAADSPEEALRLARVTPQRRVAKRDRLDRRRRPVMLQVPDPSMMCFF